ncbi:unnamed protein product [Closterium sp. NIES-65]|nr:unnamed protein product [Closterium sp. NIES-65]
MSGNVTRAHHPAFSSVPRAARIAAAKGADLWRDESICPIPSLNWKDAAAGRSATITAAAAVAAAGASAADGSGGAALVMSEVCPIPPVLWRAPPRVHESLLRGPPNAMGASPPAHVAHVAVSRGGGVRSRRIMPRSCSLDDSPGDGGGGAGATSLLKPNWPLGRSSSVDDVIPPSDAHDAASPIFPASSSGGGGAFASSGSRGHRRRHSAVPDLGRSSVTCGVSDSGGLAAGSTAGSAGGTRTAAGDASLAAAAAAVASSASGGAIAAGPAALAGHPRWNPLHRGGSVGVGGHTARDHSPARHSRLICMRQAAGHGRRSSWDGATSTTTRNVGQWRGAVAAASSSCEAVAVAAAAARTGAAACVDSAAGGSPFSTPKLRASAAARHGGTHGAAAHMQGEGKGEREGAREGAREVQREGEREGEGVGESDAEECLSQCLNWEGVEQLCESMQAAGIAIDSIDIIALPLAPSATHSHARAAAMPPPPPTALPTLDSVHAAAGKPPTPGAALAAVCEPAAGALKPCSLHPLRTAACTGPAFHPPAAAAGAVAVGAGTAAGAGAGGYRVSLAVRFCGMSTWYHPGDNTTTPAFQH